MADVDDQNALVPPIIQATLYAVCGGLSGNPVGIWLRDFSPDIVAGICRTLSQLFGDERVLELVRTSDLKQLTDRLPALRLVISYPGSLNRRLLTDADWKLERRRGCGQPIPAILTVYDSKTSESPGAHLVINGTESSNREIAKWLETANVVDLCPPRLLKDVSKSAIDVDFGLVQPLLDRYTRSHTDLSAIRTTKIVFGMLAGMACLEHSHLTEPAIVAVRHYAELFRLLQRPSFSRTDDLRDPITTAMVHRANAYLLMRSSAGENRTPLNGRPVDSPRNVANAEPSNRLITLADIADLGRPSSNRAKELISYVHREQGIKGLVSLGLTSPLSRLDGWQNADEKTIAECLIVWSLKQARTRFFQLHRQGEITAIRPVRNGPWQYQIPYDFAPGRSLFAGLPSPEAINPPKIPKEQAT